MSLFLNNAVGEIRGLRGRLLWCCYCVPWVCSTRGVSHCVPCGCSVHEIQEVYLTFSMNRADSKCCVLSLQSQVDEVVGLAIVVHAAIPQGCGHSWVVSKLFGGHDVELHDVGL